MNLPALDQVARKEAWGRQRTQQQAGPTASGAATNDVGIAGLKVVFDSSANVYRRFAWATALLICFGLMLTQTHNRLGYYLTKPTSTTVRYVANESLQFPSITLCPYRMSLYNNTSHLDPAKLQQLFHQHFPGEPDAAQPDAMYRLADIYNVQQLWNKSAWDFDEHIRKCIQGRTECAEWVPKFTVSGPCLHYVGLPVTGSGNFHGLQIEICDTDAKKTPPMTLLVDDQFNTPEIRSMTHGIFGEISDATGWNKEISISLKEFHGVNQKKKPCLQDRTETVSKCIGRCFEREFVAKSRCRMPYMTSQISIPYCKGTKQLMAAEQLQKSLLWDGVGWKPEECDCNTTTCTQYLYETYSDSFEHQEKCVFFKVFFSDMTYEETREEFAYDIVSLLCDIGGTLGLCLGASVLTLVQFIDYSAQRFSLFFSAPAAAVSSNSSNTDLVPKPAETTRVRTIKLIKTSAKPIKQRF